MYHFSLLDIGKLFSFYQTTINLSEGKGKSFRNVNSANTHKVLLLIKEHGTFLFHFKLHFPLRSATKIYSLTMISVHVHVSILSA